MEESQKELENKLKNKLKVFTEKEFEFLHYEYYIQNLIKFETYVNKNNLIEDAFEGTTATLAKYIYNKERLEKYNKSLKIVTREILYKAYYQNFEEYIYDVIFSIYSCYPEFIKKDSNQIIVNYDLIFSNKDVESIKNEIIEKKVKDLVQSNNIASLLKKFKPLFGIDLKLDLAEIKLLLLTAQNRNILTHNSGKINSIYLNELKKHKIETKYELGDNLLDSLNVEIIEVENQLSGIGKKISEQILSKLLQIDNYSKNIS